jgi:dienelactone hydrolase
MLCNGYPRNGLRRLFAVAVTILVAPAVAQDRAAVEGVVIETDVSLPTHTLFHPKRDGSHKLPLIVWENGGCRNDPTMYTPLLSQIASRGYFIIAKGFKGGQHDSPPPGANATPPSALMQMTPVQLSAEAIAAGQMPTGPIYPALFATSNEPDKLMINAIAWARKENQDPKSKYYDQIDTNRIGLTGYSCGGFTALQVAPLEKRVASVIIFNSGMNPTWTMAQGKELMATFRPGVPVAWVNGGPSDVAYVGGQRDWTLVPGTMPAMHIEYDFKAPPNPTIMTGGHTVFWLSPQTAEYQAILATIATNWFDYTLRSSNSKRHAYLFDTPCGFCADPLWSVKLKNWRGFAQPGNNTRHTERMKAYKTRHFQIDQPMQSITTRRIPFRPGIHWVQGVASSNLVAPTN